jgi:tetratricopeptide (TPR) repeat protein
MSQSDDIASLGREVVRLSRRGRSDEAVPLAARLCDLLRERFGEGHTEYARGLVALARLHEAVGDRPAAEQAFLRAVEAFRTGGGDHADFAQCLRDLATVHEARGDHARAEELFREALETDRRALGDDHLALAAGLTSLSRVCQARGKSAEAESLSRRALDLRRTLLGPGHPSVALSLRQLAGLLRATGRHTEAEPFFREALEIQRQALPPGDADYAAGLHTLGALRAELGRFEEARASLLEALACYRQMTRSRAESFEPNLAATFHQLGLVEQGLGDPEAARDWHEQALAVYRRLAERSPETYRPDLARALTSLAAAQRDLDDVKGARASLEEALLIERHLARQSPNGATVSLVRVLSTRAELAWRLGEHAAAERSYRQALDACRQAVGECHPDYAAALGNLARLYQAQGNYAEAVRHAGEAAEVCRRAVGESHIDYAAGLSSLARLHHAQGDYAAAEPLYRRALEVCRAARGEEHQDAVAGLHDLAVLLAATGRFDEALGLMQQAAGVEERLLRTVLMAGPEDRRDDWLRATRARQGAFLSLVLRHLASSPAAVRAAFDLVLRRKGLADEARAGRRSEVLARRHPDLAGQARELAALDGQLAERLASGPRQGEPLTEHLQQVAACRSRRNRLESELARPAPEIALGQRLAAADRRAVARALPERSALVEMVRCPILEFRAVPARGESRWLPARYLAFVLWGGEPDEVRLLDLGEAAAIDRLVAEFCDSVTGRAAEPAGDRPRRLPVDNGRPWFRRATRPGRPCRCGRWRQPRKGRTGLPEALGCRPERVRERGVAPPLRPGCLADERGASALVRRPALRTLAVVASVRHPRGRGRNVLAACTGNGVTHESADLQGGHGMFTCCVLRHWRDSAVPAWTASLSIRSRNIWTSRWRKDTQS